MTISATIVADSISREGKRLTTFLLRYPRFIHAELMTHRVFSRNASSSRAIPVQKMIDDLRRDPAMPVFWGSNQPGMQAGEQLTDKEIEFCKTEWLLAREDAIKTAQRLIHAGLHKQIANRILEPWAHINVVVTATEYANWFALRNHPDAQPEIHELASQMKIAMEESHPTLLQPGEWHLPFVRPHDIVAISNQITLGGILRVVPTSDQINDLARKVSTARCARTSYMTHDGRETTIEEDIALHDKLVVSVPLHASPSEHQATPDIEEECIFNGHPTIRWAHQHQHANLVGWRQYRKMLPGEFVEG